MAWNNQKSNISLPSIKVARPKLPAEHIGSQFQKNMHPSNVTNSLHGYYEADREEDFIKQHPYGIDNSTV